VSQKGPTWSIARGEWGITGIDTSMQFDSPPASPHRDLRTRTAELDGEPDGRDR